MMTGGLFYAPYNCAHFLYIQPYYITKIIPRLFPIWASGFAAKAWKKVITCVAVDKGIVTGPYLAAMLFCTGFFDTGDIKYSYNKMREKLWPTMKSNWLFWVFALAFIYGCIPMIYRPLTDALCGTMFGFIYTFIFHNNVKWWWLYCIIIVNFL